MDALAELSNQIDEIKDKLTDDQYVKMMDLTKKIHHHVLGEDTMETISHRYHCASDGVFCNCDADKRVRFMINDIMEVPRLHKLVVELAADLYSIGGSERD